MEKSKIKAILRENIFSRIKEAEPKQAEKKGVPTGEKKESGDGEKKNSKQFDKDYEEIQRKLNNTLLKQSQVMQAAGLGQSDDSTARSLFSKKVKKEINPDNGSTYQFDEDELSAVIKVINNPGSYLNVKK